MLHHRTIGTGTPIILLHGVTLDHRHMMDVIGRGAGVFPLAPKQTGPNSSFLNQSLFSGGQLPKNA